MALRVVSPAQPAHEHCSWEELRRQLCGTKRALGVKAAHCRAEQLRHLGHVVSAYGCVFCRAWHVGPAPSMETIEALARVIRGLKP